MSSMYLSGIKQLNSGGIDWLVDDIRVLLVTSAYTFDQGHDYVSDLSGELTNPGYARKLVAGRTIVEDLAGNRNKCDAANTLFAALGAGDLPAAAIVYLYNVADTAAQLLAYCALTTTPPNGADFTVVWNTLGVFTAGN
jgi:hypothetical protein